ncbi:MAG: hypothetical protein JO045_18350 [Mycobacterium sp.]|nr:hypothetical protein [Mycobacterium sp.]
MPLTTQRSRPGGASPCDPCGLHTLRHYYSRVVDAFAARFGERLWITGGWVRAELSGSKYFGDIDCIIVAGAQQVRQFAIAAGFDLTTAPLGAPRVVLFDGNHMDIIPASGATAEDAVPQALNVYNFSINSAAVNYLTGAVVRTPHNAEDAAAGAFRVNDGFDHRCSDRMLARDFEIFEKYYGLKPVLTPPTLRVQKLMRSYGAHEDGADATRSLGARSDEVAPCLPPAAEAWIVRGTVRCALLGQIKYWDDIDVITTASNDDIVRYLAEARIPFSPNYFGTPKVITPNGLKADIWTLGGHTLETELAGYPHNLDAIAWSVRDRCLCDPLGVAEAIAQRRLDISPVFIDNASAHDLHYTALKSIYLIIRHALIFSDRAAELMRTPVVPEPFLIKHLIRLLRELCLCVPPQTIARAIAELENKLGACDAMRLVHTYG